MRIFLRLVTGPIILGFILALSLNAGAGASARKPLLPRSPLSGSVLLAREIHSGAVQFPHPGTLTNDIHPHLSCSPAPCVLPNTQASIGHSGNIVNEDPIAVDPKNPLNLLSGGNDYNCGSSLAGFYLSTDGGNTWSATCIGSITGFGCGDPGVGWDLHHTAYITSIDCGLPAIQFEKSTNMGVTWSAPAVAVRPLFSGGFTDKDWLQVDDGPKSDPYRNSLYISVTQFDSSGNSTISVSHSTNGGATWSAPIQVDSLQLYPSVDQFSDITTGRNGTVYVTWMRCYANGPAGDCGGTTATLLMSDSTDGGNTWSTPATIATVNLAPDACFCAFYGNLPNTSERVSEIPAIGVDNSTSIYSGTLYVVMYNWTGSYMEVEVATSTNGGASWSAPVRVTPTSDTHDQFFPWLTVNHKGVVGVTWLDRRNDPSNIDYEAFSSISTNHGASFQTNQQIASVASNPFDDGFGGGFMGDYTGNSWAKRTSTQPATLYASWMDMRNGSYSQDWVGGYEK
jgi:hypothetical protein